MEEEEEEALGPGQSKFLPSLRGCGAAAGGGRPAQEEGQGQEPRSLISGISAACADGGGQPLISL
eukprot:9503610-Pyramimonas_sp.AAC.1